MAKIVNTHARTICKKQKPLLLFDIDGTLLITGGSSNRALERVFFEQFGVNRAMDGINPNGKTAPDFALKNLANIDIFTKIISTH